MKFREQVAEIEGCRLIDFPAFRDERGALTFIEPGALCPFEIARVFYLYDIPPARARGAHAHRECRQLILSVSGEVTARVDDGLNKFSFDLKKPNQALLVPPMIWVELTKASPGHVTLVLASMRYDEADYVRNYRTFKDLCARG